MRQGTNVAWRARALISRSALMHNIAAIRTFSRTAKLYGVVKADAYGHGIAQLAECEPALDGFAVATIEEGIELRQLISNTTPIIVLSEFNHRDQLSLFQQYRLQLVIHHIEQLDWLESNEFACGNNLLAAWIKLDTGMNRLGFPMEMADGLMQRFQSLSHVEHCGIMSHLASADEPDNKQTRLQFQAFTQLQRFSLPLMSLNNSAGILTLEHSSSSMVRPGILLYGACPIPDYQHHFIPVMTFQSRLIDIKKIEAGDLVGYGGTWASGQATRIGVIACGYADGYPRLASNRGQVFIGTKKADIAGRVSMDTMVVDLTGHHTAARGDIVELWGKHIPVRLVADWSETIPYELLCKVGNRVPRVSVE